jgi:hypothetical protein
VLCLGVTLAVLADRLVDAVSVTRAVHAGRLVACGAPGATVAIVARPVRVALRDGRRVRVGRLSGPPPSCGATIDVAERATPWGTTFYAIPPPPTR